MASQLDRVIANDGTLILSGLEFAALIAELETADLPQATKDEIITCTRYGCKGFGVDASIGA